MIIYDILLILQYQVSTTVMDVIVVFCIVSCLYLCLRCCVSVLLPYCRWIKIYILRCTETTFYEFYNGRRRILNLCSRWWLDCHLARIATWTGTSVILCMSVSCTIYINIISCRRVLAGLITTRSRLFTVCQQLRTDLHCGTHCPVLRHGLDADIKKSMLPRP